jgi:hypothetical protein
MSKTQNDPECWTNPAAKRPGPFRFDGHGINDADGQRIAKVSVQSCAGGRKNPEFERLSLLLAAAQDMFEALEFCITVEGATCFARMDTNPEYMKRRLDRITAVAEIAIAKAKGEQ